MAPALRRSLSTCSVLTPTLTVMLASPAGTAKSLVCGEDITPDVVRLRARSRSVSSARSVRVSERVVGRRPLPFALVAIEREADVRAVVAGIANQRIEREVGQTIERSALVVLDLRITASLGRRTGRPIDRGAAPEHFMEPIRVRAERSSGAEGLRARCCSFDLLQR